MPLHERRRSPRRLAVSGNPSPKHERAGLPLSKAQTSPQGGSPWRQQTPVEMMAPVPLPTTNGRCGFGKETFAGTRGNGREAPKPAVRQSWVERVKPTLRRHSPPRQRMVGSGREADIRTASQVKLRGSRSLAPKNPAGAGAMRRSATWAPCWGGSTVTQPRGSTSCSPGIGKAGLPDWLHKRCLRGGDHGKRIEGIQASRFI